MDAGARGLEDDDCGYGLVDYAYCKEIQDAFHRDYVPGNVSGELPDYSYDNETELKEYQMPEIAALWNADGHDKLIATSVKGSKDWQTAYSSDKIKVLQKVSYCVDTKIGTSGGKKIILSEVGFIHAYGKTNYIAAVCYLYRLAKLQHASLKKPITTIMKNCVKEDRYGLDPNSTSFKDLNKAVNIICKGEFTNGGNIPTASYSGTTEEKAGKNRCLRILGMAMHVAGDAYAHKAIVPNSAEVIQYFKSNRGGFFTNYIANTKIPNDLAKPVKTDCITMSRLSDWKKTKIYVTTEEKGEAVHRHYADNPGFCPRRYQYGAQNVVEDLLFYYYKKFNSFNVLSFYNYGANKNNIYQYRLDKYANQASGVVNPGNVNWKAYSGDNIR